MAVSPWGCGDKQDKEYFVPEMAVVFLIFREAAASRCWLREVGLPVRAAEPVRAPPVYSSSPSKFG
jgi:hypothetical protein